MMSSNLELARHLLLTAASDDAPLGSACGRPPKVRHEGSSPSGCGGASKVQYYSRLRSHGARKKAYFVVTLGNVLSYDFETFIMYSRELSGFSPSQSILRSVGLFASFLSVAMTNIKSFTAIKDVCGTAHLLLLFLSIAISLSLQIVPFPTRSFVPGARRRKLFAPEEQRAIAELRRRRRPFGEGGVAFKVFCAEQLLFLGSVFPVFEKHAAPTMGPVLSPTI